MKRNFLIGMISLAFVTMSFVAVSNFVLTNNKVNSGLRFSIKHLGISDFVGAFTDFDTKITTESNDLEKAKIEFSARTFSINTFNEQRDNHLRSSDFLNTEKFPEMKFVSTKITKGKKNNYVVVGDFTFHGVTKSVTMNAVLNGVFVNPETKNEVYGIKFDGSINRLDFGVGVAYPSQMFSNEIKFEATLEMNKNMD